LSSNTLDSYISNVEVVEDKEGVRELKVTPKGKLAEQPLLYLCTYVLPCGFNINGFCTANVKYCDKRVLPK
jgi:hypothetical protein